MAEISRAQCQLLGRLVDIWLALHDQANLAALTEDVVKTSEIEGERLRRPGADIGAPVDIQ
jgi:hypothetical protein